MNKISCKFVESDLTDGCEVIIDGKQTDDYFDIPGFVLSVNQDGIFPMFTGCCGIFGCCGIYVEVKHEEDTIIWQKFWNGQCGGEPDPEDKIIEFQFTEDFIVKPPLIFNQDEYKKLADVLVGHIKKTPDRWEWFLETMERYKTGDKFNT